MMSAPPLVSWLEESIPKLRTRTTIVDGNNRGTVIAVSSANAQVLLSSIIIRNCAKVAFISEKG